MEKELTYFFKTSLTTGLVKLKTDSKAQWGTMTAQQMLMHLIQSSRMMHFGNNNLLIKEKYIGIRPAPGYPSCPDHSEKLALFDLLDIKNNSKLQLTESYAVYPASSVSGWYFSHPESRYFGISRINEEQLINYSNRKKMEKEKLIKIFPQVIDL